MRDSWNSRLTNHETVVGEDQYLISKTDRKGIIIYANPAFVEISGYARDELIGSPHNIVRHPEMPSEAFGDLWHTIRAGGTWQGLVKNRRKDGGYYWVLATVSPIMVDGEVAGYASVRVKPTEEQIATAEDVYADIREHGEHSAYVLQRGHIQSRRFAWLHRFGRWVRIGGKGGIPVDRALLTLGLLFCAVESLMAWAGIAPFGLETIIPIVTGLLLVVLLLQIRASSRQRRDSEGAIRTIQQIAGGNLMDGSRHGSAAEQEQSGIDFYLGVMKKSLVSISRDVHQSLGATVAAARRLGDNSTLLSSRTQEQAAALQEIAVSVDSLSASVQDNAERTVKAESISQINRKIAQESKACFEELTVRMQSIRERSEQESQIITMIDSIAFQTNILALNAAVEASRAGHAGRGFAVVASSIRELAEKTTAAAKDIKLLVDESVRGAEDGVQLAGKAGQKIQEMVSAVQDVATLMAEVSAANTHQASGITQLRAAIISVDHLTQQNAVMVDDLNDTAKVMNQRSAALSDAIEVLDVGRAQHPGDRSGNEQESLAPAARSRQRRVRGAPRPATRIPAVVRPLAGALQPVGVNIVR